MGISVDFKYSEIEKKKYQAAQKALHRCRVRSEKRKERRQKYSLSEIHYFLRRNDDSILPGCAVFFFMCYEIILCLKSFSTYLVENNVLVDTGKCILDVANILGLISTLFIVIAVLYFTLSQNDSFGDNLLEVCWSMIKCFAKSVIVWIVIFVIIYVLSHFIPKDSALYSLLYGNSREYDTLVSTEIETSGEVFDDSIDDPLEEELEHLAIQNEQSTINDFIEIYVESANIRSGPGTQYDILATGYMGEFYRRSGNEEIAINGSTWYEIYLDSEREKVGWVSEKVASKLK